MSLPSAYRRLLLLCLLSLLASGGARAQWTQLHTFGSLVSSVKFLGDVGLPNLGFVGAGSFVYRTADGGTIWSPVLRVTGASASAFSFKDGQTGWCTMYGLTTGYACYKTTDGGVSWRALAPLGEGCDVLYNRATDILLVSIRSGQVLASIDGGNSFVVSQAGMNGFAFASGSNGICTSINAGLNAFASTTDGGQTWSNTLDGQHCWSPCAVPGTPRYVAPRDLTQEVFTSSNLGVSWQATGRVNGALTGCAQATDCAIYVQSSIGMFVSTNGSAWTYLVGSPGNDYDTRFCVSGGDVFAGDAAGQVFRASASVTTWPSVRFDQFQKTISASPGCGVKQVPANFYNFTCSDITVLSITLSDSSAWDVSSERLPKVLGPGDSLGMLLDAASDSGGVFKTRLTIRLKNAVGTADTTFTLTLDASRFTAPVVGPLVMAGVQCEPRDTLVRIHNNQCDTITLTTLKLDAPSQFVLLPISLPILLAPDSDLLVPVRFVGDKSGDSRTALHATFTYRSILLDTTIDLDAHVAVARPSALLSASTIQFDTVTTCAESERTLTIRNTSCDAVSLTELTLVADPGITLESVALPLIILSGDSVTLHVHFKPSALGLAGGHLDIMLSHEGIEKLFGADITGLGIDAPHGIAVRPSAIVADSLSPCESFDTTLTLQVTGPCDSLLVTSATTDDPNVRVSAQPVLPAVLHSGDTLRIKVHLDPGTRQSDALVHFLGPKFDSSVALHCSFRAIAAPELTMSVSKTTFTLHQCDLDSGTFTLGALGCTAIDVDSIALAGAANFQLDGGGTKSCSIAPGRDTLIRFYISGDASGKPGSYFALLTVISKQGFRHTVPLFATVLPQDSTELALRRAPGASGNRVDPGASVTSEIYFVRGVSQASGLTRMDCSIAFDRDMLGDIAITPMNGWSVAVVGQSNAGLDVQCTRAAATAIAAGEMLLTIQHRATVSRSLTTHVRLASVALMPGVARYSDCVLASSFDSSGFSEEISYACPDSTLAKFLRGELPLADLKVKPQPANSKVMLTLRASEAGVTQFTIVDVTGREVRRVTENLHPGLNECELDIRGLPSGSYRVSARLPTSYRLWAPLTIAR